MENLFSIGELSRYQNISKQTLIFYDKTGVFHPAYVDPSNGYRYYSASQLDELDTILILKKSGLSLQKIKELLSHYTTQSSLKVLKSQLGVIDRQMEELRLVRSRLSQRCAQLEGANLHQEGPRVEEMEEQYVLTRPVEPPFTLREISIATKQCFAQAFQESLPIFFQSGVRVPLERILRGDYTQADLVFLPTEKNRTGKQHPAAPGGAVCRHLPPGGLPVHRGILRKAAGLLPGAGVGGDLRLLRVLHQRLHHHRRRKRIPDENRLLCGRGRVPWPTLNLET